MEHRVGRADRPQGEARQGRARSSRLRRTVRHGRVCGDPSRPAECHQGRPGLGLSSPQRWAEGAALERTAVDRSGSRRLGGHAPWAVRAGRYPNGSRPGPDCCRCVHPLVRRAMALRAAATPSGGSFTASGSRNSRSSVQRCPRRGPSSWGTSTSAFHGSGRPKVFTRR